MCCYNSIQFQYHNSNCLKWLYNDKKQQIHREAVQDKIPCSFFLCFFFFIFFVWKYTFVNFHFGTCSKFTVGNTAMSNDHTDNAFRTMPLLLSSRLTGKHVKLQALLSWKECHVSKTVEYSGIGKEYSPSDQTLKLAMKESYSLNHLFFKKCHRHSPRFSNGKSVYEG